MKGSSELKRRVVGVDVGGTFTDLLLYETGPGGARVRLAKIPTTAANQAAAVLAAIADTGVDPADLDLIIHGTTATTNALLERKLARVGLITTAGFRDTLELGRRTRPKPYGMTGQFEPLIPRVLTDLAALAPSALIPAHCTGWRAQHAMAGQFGEAYVPNAVGSRFVF